MNDSMNNALNDTRATNTTFNKHATNHDSHAFPVVPPQLDVTIASTLDVPKSSKPDSTYTQRRSFNRSLAMTPAIDSNGNLASTLIDINHDNDHDHIDHGMTTIVGLITDAHSPPAWPAGATRVKLHKQILKSSCSYCKGCPCWLSGRAVLRG